MPQRRKFITGAAPFVVTLMSRPALANICTGSAMLSVNISADTPTPAGTMCGASPECWHSRALRETSAWVGTSYSENQTFAGLFTGPGVTVAGTIGWHIGSGSLDDALQGNVSVVYQKGTSGMNQFIIPANAATFVKETVAALLNASAFNSSLHFNLAVSDVLGAVKSIWTTTPTNDGQLNSTVDAVSSSFFNARNGGVFTSTCDV